jgi:hypothetical protein
LKKKKHFYSAIPNKKKKENENVTSKPTSKHIQTLKKKKKLCETMTAMVFTVV